MINKLDYWRGLELGTHNIMINKLDYWKALGLRTQIKQARILAGSRAGDTR